MARMQVGKIYIYVYHIYIEMPPISANSLCRINRHISARGSNSKNVALQINTFGHASCVLISAIFVGGLFSRKGQDEHCLASFGIATGRPLLSLPSERDSANVLFRHLIRRSGPKSVARNRPNYTGIPAAVAEPGKMAKQNNQTKQFKTKLGFLVLCACRVRLARVCC